MVNHSLLKNCLLKHLFNADIIYPNGTIKTVIDLKCTNPKLNETHFLTWIQILAAIQKNGKIPF